MKRQLLLTTSLTLCSALSLMAVAWANPQDGQVKAGQAVVEVGGKLVTVNQSSDRAVIDWRSFDIGKDETTRFVQPSSSSLTVNRVTDGNPTEIWGNLTANGNLVLINRSGISFEAGSVIDVNSLLATSADIRNDDAMAGNLVFGTPGEASAVVSNAGTITAAEAGLVGLVAPHVENSGIINAKLGQVHLASGDKLTLDLYGDGALSVTASDALTSQLVKQIGSINAQGGRVQLTAAAGAQVIDSLIQVEGEIKTPSATQQGGRIIISGDANKTNIGITGTLDASGTQGGSISVSGHNVIQQGQLHADGSAGQGGQVNISAKTAYLDNEASQVTAIGQGGNGGQVSVTGGSGAQAFVSGTYDASSSTNKGGRATLTTEGGSLKLYGAHVRADGATGGGTLEVGGALHGAVGVARSATTAINYATTLSADATENGDGGSVVVWSDSKTSFGGHALARGGLEGGNGGQLEVSSADTLNIASNAETSAAARTSTGTAGTLLLDPKNIVIATGGLNDGLSYFEFVDPNPDAGSFGGYITVLSTGNVLVTDIEDDLMARDGGAVYLFNGATGALISTLYGTSNTDNVGYAVTALTNGNYVVRNSLWDNGAIPDAGAATWGSGTTGVSGAVSSANSLVGSTASDQVGYYIAPLTNGNYVVGTTSWDNGAIFNAGAATWANGTTGITGTISSTNSLVGSRANDSVGGAAALSNGNYVVVTPTWDNGAVSNAGAATWANGTTGITGTISSANSLVGTKDNDLVGISVAALSNGNYVVRSPYWGNGTYTSVGAATWGNGTTGITGAVSSSNSLVGSRASDQVGISITMLTNGNYVLRSASWDNGAIANVGSVTWGNGTTGISGLVSSANSLIGSTANDGIGNNVTALTNGNYVISSYNWDNGALSNAGAATWANGTTGITGTISSANSLVGSTASDQVGNNVTALTNGNYVVASPNWDNGGLANLGAVTWGNGVTGTTGTVSSSNSLIGSTAWDQVGGTVLALTNGNYVVKSYNWDNGATLNVGAATWGSGTAGVTGTISSSNSLIGSSANDQVGLLGIYALANGNYVVTTSNWDNGAIADVGAITWGNGSTGISGFISSSNSLIGTTNGDMLGNGMIFILGNGNYLVNSATWDNGAILNAGAITLGDGATGITGSITSQNSFTGTIAGEGSRYSIYADNVNNRFIISNTTTLQKAYSYDASYKALTSYNSFSDSSTSSVTFDPSFITNVLNAGTSVSLQASNDITLSDDLLANNASGNGGSLTFTAGRSILLNADIDTDNGDLTLVANADLAAGVVDGERDAGAAAITMGAGASINAGNGVVSVLLDDGAGKTNASAGDVTLRDITANSIVVENRNTSGDVVLASGTLTGSAASSPLILASKRNFINNSGASALSTPSGRWLVYSSNPDDDALGGLSGSFRRFSCNYGGSCPTLGSGNGLLYSSTPLLTITPSALSATYGDAVPSLSGYSYAVSGYLGSDSGDDSLSGTLTGSTTYTQGSNAGSYNINHASGTLSSSMGYGFTYANNATALSVAKKAITAAFAASLSKTYGDANPSIDYTNFTFTGLVGSDSGSLFSSITPNFGGVDANTGVGSYAVSASIGATANYTVSNTPSTTLDIGARALTVTTDAANKTYGDADPAFTGSHNLTAHDAALVSWLYAPDSYSGTAGTYTIAATATDPSSRLANYTRTDNYGLLTVLPRPITPVTPAASLPDTVVYNISGGLQLPHGTTPIMGRESQPAQKDDTQSTSPTQKAVATSNEEVSGEASSNEDTLAEDELPSLLTPVAGESDAKSDDRRSLFIHPALLKFLRYR